MAEQDERTIEVSDAPSPSASERMLKNKWLLSVGGIALLIVLIITLTNRSPPPPERRDVRERAVRLIPGDIRETDWIAEAQAELRANRQRMEEILRDNRDMRTDLQREREQSDRLRDQVNRTLQELERSNSNNERLVRQLERRGEEPQQRPTPPPALPEPTLPEGVVPPPRPADILDDSRDVASTLRPDLRPPVRTVGPPSAGQPIVVRGVAQVAQPSVPTQPTNEVVVRNEYAGYLPAGAFAEVALLTGAEVGTADFTRANPQPFLMRVQAPAVIAGDGRYQLTACFAIGSGFGELSSERAHVRVNRLVCMDHANRLVLEETIDAFLVDSDGTQGLRGEVVRRNGQMIARGMVAGIAEGIAEVARATSEASSRMLTSPIAGGVITTATEIDAGRLAEAGLFGGAANAASRLADMYVREARQIFPVIRVPAGRKGTLVVLEGQSLEWKSYDGLYSVRREPMRQNQPETRR